MPVAVLAAGLLVHGAVTVWDLVHFEEIFYGGTSQNGAVAYLFETGFAYLRLTVTAVLVPVLWVAARRASRPGSRSPGVVGPLCGFLTVCGGGWVAVAPNDGSDPRRLGLVHGPGVPGWITVADAVAPYAVLAGAAGATLLVVVAFIAWIRQH